MSNVFRFPTGNRIETGIIIPDDAVSYDDLVDNDELFNCWLEYCSHSSQIPEPSETEIGSPTLKALHQEFDPRYLGSIVVDDSN